MIREACKLMENMQKDLSYCFNGVQKDINTQRLPVTCYLLPVGSENRINQ